MLNLLINQRSRVELYLLEFWWRHVQGARKLWSCLNLRMELLMAKLKVILMQFVGLGAWIPWPTTRPRLPCHRGGVEKNGVAVAPPFSALICGGFSGASEDFMFRSIGFPSYFLVFVFRWPFDNASGVSKGHRWKLCDYFPIFVTKTVETAVMNKLYYYLYHSQH